jgi:hypothetical protein
MLQSWKRLAQLILAIALAIAISIVIACGGGGDDEEEDTPTPEATAEETPEDDEQVAEDSVIVNQEFWHAGWKVTLGEATVAESDTGSGELFIEAEFENLGTDEATFDSQLLVTSGGNDYADETFEGHDLPTVPGLRTGDGGFNFVIDEEFVLDEATLIVGNPANQQATVPIGSEGDDLVSLEPTEIEASGTATAGALTLNVERAVLRADLPDKHSQMKAGTLALTVYFSATPSSGIQIGQGVLQDPNVLLELPNGTSVAVISDGVSGVNELLQGKEGTTIPDLAVRFEVEEPAAGEYAFVVRGKYGPGGADAEGKFVFTVPGEEDSASPTP